MTEACFTLPDGRVITWYETGHGRPLVLLHGWAASAAVFSEMAVLLAADYRLLIPDLPGHGKSSPAAQNDLAGISTALGCWLTAVAEGPLGLVGWSLGGMLCLELAHRGAVTVDSMVLIGVTPRFTSSGDWSNGLPRVEVRALARNLERRFAETLAGFFALAFAGEDLPEERLRQIRSFAVKRSPMPEPGAALGLLDELAHQDQRAMLASITTPTLVIHGELDRIAPAAAGQSLAAMLPQGQFVPLPAVGHAPFLSQPDAVAARIREFC